MLSIETSFGLAFDTTINDVIVVGDFNLDMQKRTSRRKTKTLCHMYCSDIISEPTHFTESSSSLIDLFLVTNKNHILLSGVGEPFLDQNIRFHCPIFCVLNLDKTITHEYEREIWLYDKGNYNSLTNEFITPIGIHLRAMISTYTRQMLQNISSIQQKCILQIK